MTESNEQQPLVHLFTDGACSGNPGPGGWAFILRHIASGKEMEASDAEEETTNNRMELTAVVEGLRTLYARDAVVEIAVCGVGRRHEAIVHVFDQVSNIPAYG